MLLAIGSLALKIALPSNEVLGRTPKDFDYMCTYEAFEEHLNLIGKYNTIVHCEPISKGKKFHVVTHPSNSFDPIHYEYEIAWPGSTAEWFLQIENRGDGAPMLAASIEGLYALKMSHRYKKNSPHFYKTMRDIQLMRKVFNIKHIDPEYVEWFKAREKETYDYGHPKLNQSKESFFSNDGVNYIYDHDDIHKAVAISDKPAYKYYQSVEDEVKTLPEAFFAVGEEIRQLGVLEEAYVLALERAVIPNNVEPRKAFLIALEKICTSITSGWFREYAWENFDMVVENYDPYYVFRFRQALVRGEIRTYKL